ncbi:alpha/beta fold hydrolase [Thalassobacillus devorans]|uniref:alpha/beta fold hydrolase n=1 Tax=Thalassobacillus devorans TaxID=279813 RepID=UPI001592EEC0|nr:alpha/beta hydrolase [Thalassobacillus devorans]
MPQFTYDSCTIYYEDIGKGIPLVLIHPPGMGRMVFTYQHTLSSQYRLLIPDLSGHGDSSIAKEPVTMERYAAEIKALLDHTGTRQAVICGYSAGGGVAQEFALAYPERTRALVLSGGYPKVAASLLKMEYRIGMKWLTTSPDSLIRILARSHFLDTNVQQTISGQMTKADLKSWYDFYEESFHYDCSERLSNIDCPILLMYGSRVKWIRQHSHYYHQCKDVLLVHIEKATHQLPTKHWHTFNHHLHSFIQDTLAKNSYHQAGNIN